MKAQWYPVLNAYAEIIGLWKDDSLRQRNLKHEPGWYAGEGTHTVELPNPPKAAAAIAVELADLQEEMAANMYTYTDAQREAWAKRNTETLGRYISAKAREEGKA